VKIAVLGGGAAGLSAGLTLRRAGVEATVFEAERMSGGKIATVEAEGFLFEAGPNSLTAQSPLAAALAYELRLEPMPVRPPNARFVVRGGRPRRAPSLSLLSPLGALRALLEPLFAMASSKREDDESLAAFLVRHFGTETGSLLANVLASGVYAGDPERLSAAEAFPRFFALAKTGALGSVVLGGLSRAFSSRGPKKEHGTDRTAPPRSLWSLPHGLQELPAAMARALGSALRLGARVSAIVPEGPGWQVGLGDSSGGLFDGVVCALPSPLAAELLDEVSPAASQALARIRYSPLAVVHLGVRSADLRVPARGFGVLDGEAKLNVLGTLFPSSLFAARAPADHAVLTSMVGGMRRPELARLPDDELIALVRADLGRVLGLTGTPVIHRVHRWEAAVPQYEVGHRANVEIAEREVAKLPSFQLAGAAYHGVSVELALQSGAAAAQRLLTGSPHP
jgi:protoporphyrinogen/coproporphyrinogen III oxidase